MATVSVLLEQSLAWSSGRVDAASGVCQTRRGTHLRDVVHTAVTIHPNRVDPYREALIQGVEASTRLDRFCSVPLFIKAVLGEALLGATLFALHKVTFETRSCTQLHQIISLTQHICMAFFHFVQAPIR